MAVTHRLQELRAAGKHEMADTLAVAALRNERPSVTVEVDHVRVETKTFVGEHALDDTFDPNDESTLRKALSRRGTYALGEEMNGRTFATGCLYDTIVERLLEADHRAKTDAPREAPTDTTTAEPNETTESVESTKTTATDDRPEDDVAPVGPVEANRSPTSVIRQAVAAVQSQLRN